MALEEPFVCSKDGDIIQEKMLRGPLLQRGKLGRGTIMNGTQSSENAHLMPRPYQDIYVPEACYNSDTPSNFSSAHICSAFIYSRKEKAAF